MVDLPISGMPVLVRAEYNNNPTGVKAIHLPPLIRGHTIVCSLISEIQPIVGIHHKQQVDFWVNLGTGLNIEHDPGFLIHISFSQGCCSLIHLRPPHGWLSNCSVEGKENRISPVVLDINNHLKNIDTYGTFRLWVSWREGLLFVGLGDTIGGSVVLATDAAHEDGHTFGVSDEVPEVLDTKKPFKGRFATDEITSILVGWGDPFDRDKLDAEDGLKDEDLLSSLRPTIQLACCAAWSNSYCRYTRALPGVDAALREACPRDKLILDHRLGRCSREIICPKFPSCVPLARLAHWLRYTFVPESDKCGVAMTKRVLGHPQGCSGHSVEVECVRYVPSRSHCPSKKHAPNDNEGTSPEPFSTTRSVLIRVRVTSAMYKVLCGYDVLDTTRYQEKVSSVHFFTPAMLTIELRPNISSNSQRKISEDISCASVTQGSSLGKISSFSTATSPLSTICAATASSYEVGSLKVCA